MADKQELAGRIGEVRGHLTEWIDQRVHQALDALQARLDDPLFRDHDKVAVALRDIEQEIGFLSGRLFEIVEQV